MLYALLKLVHLWSVIIWLGGMFFTLFCLRPGLSHLQPAARVPAMHAVLQRFFAVVAVAGLVAVASGIAMVLRAAQAAHQAATRFNMPLDWMVMAAFGVWMLLIFGHVRFALFRRLTRAVQDQDWPGGAKVLTSIRLWVAINLGIGTLITVVVMVGMVS